MRYQWLLVLALWLVWRPAHAQDCLHTVQPGDTLQAIAAAHDTTTEQLADWNDIADPDALEVAAVLQVADCTPEAVPVAKRKRRGTSPALVILVGAFWTLVPIGLLVGLVSASAFYVLWDRRQYGFRLERRAARQARRAAEDAAARARGANVVCRYCGSWRAPVTGRPGTRGARAVMWFVLIFVSCGLGLVLWVLLNARPAYYCQDCERRLN